MCDEIRIRWAGPDDSQAIAEIHVCAWRAAYEGIVPAEVLEGLSVADRAVRHRARIAENPNRMAVAKADGRILGFAALGDCRDDDKPGERTGEVFAIYVDPSRWREGIGGKLLVWAEAELCGRDKREVVLWVLRANAASRRFYQAHGYRPDGTQKTLTIGDEIEAVRYAKVLSGSSGLS